MVDAVSTVLPGVASGSAAAVDADAQPAHAAFPAVLGQVLAQPVGTANGSTPPAVAGQMLPAQAAAVVMDAPLIGLSGKPAAPDGLPTDAAQRPPVATAAVAVVDALDGIAAGQKAVPASAQPAASPVVGQPAATVAVARVSDRVPGVTGAQTTDVDPTLAQTATASQIVESSPGAAPKPARRPATVESAVPGQPSGDLQLQTAPIEPTAASPAASTAAPALAVDSGRAGSAARQIAERPVVSVPAPAVSGGSEAALAASGARSADSVALVAAAVPGNDLAAAMLVPGRPGTAAAQGAPPMDLLLAASPGSPQFSHELGERLLWLVREGVHEARLQLNPRELGPIEVRLGVSDGAAQVSFSAQHAGTAAAVQQSLPQLRELLAQQGLQLGQAEVFQQQAGAGQQMPQGGTSQQAGGDARGLASVDLDAPVIGERLRVIGRGLVDAYA